MVKTRSGKKYSPLKVKTYKIASLRPKIKTKTVKAKKNFFKETSAFSKTNNIPYTQALKHPVNITRFKRGTIAKFNKFLVPVPVSKSNWTDSDDSDDSDDSIYSKESPKKYTIKRKPTTKYITPIQTKKKYWMSPFIGDSDVPSVSEDSDDESVWSQK